MALRAVASENRACFPLTLERLAILQRCVQKRSPAKGPGTPDAFAAHIISERQKTMGC